MIMKVKYYYMYSHMYWCEENILSYSIKSFFYLWNQHEHKEYICKNLAYNLAYIGFQII